MKSNIVMKKIIPVIKVKTLPGSNRLKLSEKVISKTAEAHTF